MIFVRTSILSGITRTKEFDVTEEQYNAWRDGALIQNVMPNLSDEDREFLISGATAEEWDAHHFEEEVDYGDYDEVEDDYCPSDDEYLTPREKETNDRLDMDSNGSSMGIFTSAPLLDCLSIILALGRSRLSHLRLHMSVGLCAHS